MGFISDRMSSGGKSAQAGGKATTLAGRRLPSVQPRKTPMTDAAQAGQLRGGSYASSASTANSTELLLRALRSQAPGGWSDDRWEQTRHFVGIAYVCIHRKCEQLSQSEFQVFRKDPQHPEGKRPVNRNDPSYKLVKLLERPNSQDSFGDLMYRWGQQLDLTGTSLTWMAPNRLGRPMELYPIPTALAIPQPTVVPEYPEGYWRIQPVYPYGPFSSFPTPASAVGAPIPGQWMMKVQYPHPFLRYDGYSPLTALRLHLDEVEAIDRSRWYSMKRTTSPSAMLNMEQFQGAEGAGSLPEPEVNRLRTQFENAFQGVENTGKLFIPPPGTKLEPWGGRPVDMEYQAGWDQLTSFGMAGFGITKPAAGMIEDSSYASLFATLKQLHLLTLQPLCARIASRLTRVLGPFFGEDLIVEVRTPRIDDHDLKQARLNFLKDCKALTKNEARRECEMPPNEEWGDEIAGYEEPPEQPGMVPGIEGMPQQGQEQQGGDPIGQLLGTEQGGDDPLAELLGDDMGMPAEMQGPDTGGLGKDSMNPRKSLLNGKPHKNGRVKCRLR